MYLLTKVPGFANFYKIFLKFKVWNLSGEELCCLKDHNSNITGCCFSADSTKLATCSQDKTIRVSRLTLEIVIFLGL